MLFTDYIEGTTPIYVQGTQTYVAYTVIQYNDLTRYPVSIRELEAMEHRAKQPSYWYVPRKITIGRSLSKRRPLQQEYG